LCLAIMRDPDKARHLETARRAIRLLEKVDHIAARVPYVGEGEAGACVLPDEADSGHPPHRT
jgi:hypothetical protein